MKRIIALLLTALLALPMAAMAEKAASLPDAFQVKYTVKERTISNDRCFVSKEYVTTVNEAVDREINALVDAFDDAMASSMTPDPAKNPKRNSRLDIHVVHSVSGESCVSFLVLARESFNRVQKQSPIAGRVFDMATGRQVTLTDLFDEDSEAWDVILSLVYEELNAYFPQEEADPEALKALCTKESLLETPFMLGPVCLSFHYETKVLYPDRATLMKVTVPYHALEGMMTEYGQRQTDNSNYKMVALTFDDGPSYTNTAVLLNSLRRSGAVGTFFLVGERILEYPDIAMRENDENHSLQSHHYYHVDTAESSVELVQRQTRQFYDVLTETVGTEPWMLRAPYGSFDGFIRAEIELPLIQWDVDTKDWTGRTTAAILNVLKEEVVDGSVILMHDIKDNTPQAVTSVVEWLHERGYLCVTVEDLFIQMRQPFNAYQIYFRIHPNTEDFYLVDEYASVEEGE